MNVFIIDREFKTSAKYQIMVKRGSGFDHVFPGTLFTIEKAVETCNRLDFTIIKIGTLWECI